MSKISALTDGAPAVNATDFVPISRSGANYKLSLTDLKAIAAITSGSVTGITDLAVTDGGTGASTAQVAAGNLSVPYTLLRGGIPIIGLSSGSVAANGAISGISALPRAYPNAYCYFPANILATTIAAGFYYCTFSTTTAGVAFLNTLSSWPAAIPGSPTAVTDGRGAFTGDTNEVTAVSVTVPALGANSVLRILNENEETNNANNKTTKIKLGGTIFVTHLVPSVARGGGTFTIHNTGATGKQISGSIGQVLGNAPTVDVLGTVDTSVSTTLLLTIQRATATDNFILLPTIVELLF